MTRIGQTLVIITLIFKRNLENYRVGYRKAGAENIGEKGWKYSNGCFPACALGPMLIRPHPSWAWWLPCVIS